MALGRLMYPFFLEYSPKYRYEGYIKSNNMEIMEILVAERELEALHFMCKNRYADAEGISNAASKASMAGWVEGTASLLKWKHGFIEDAKKRRYKF